MTAVLTAPMRTTPSEPRTISFRVPMMGGSVGVHLQGVPGTDASVSHAESVAQATLRRLQVWADRLTRFTDTSDLARLNASPDAEVPISRDPGGRPRLGQAGREPE